LRRDISEGSEAHGVHVAETRTKHRRNGGSPTKTVVDVRLVEESHATIEKCSAQFTLRWLICQTNFFHLWFSVGYGQYHPR